MWRILSVKPMNWVISKTEYTEHTLTCNVKSKVCNFIASCSGTKWKFSFDLVSQTLLICNWSGRYSHPILNHCHCVRMVGMLKQTGIFWKCHRETAFTPLKGKPKKHYRLHIRKGAYFVIQASVQCDMWQMSQKKEMSLETFRTSFEPRRHLSPVHSDDVLLDLKKKKIIVPYHLDILFNCLSGTIKCVWLT